MCNMPGKNGWTEYNQQNCFLLNPKQRKSAFLLRLWHANVKKLRKTVLIKNDKIMGRLEKCRIEEKNCQVKSVK